MRIGRIVLAGLALLSLGACSYYRDWSLRHDFEESTREYNRQVRWQETEQACMIYVDKAIREQFLARVKAAKEVKIADYRIKTLEWEKGQKEATATVEMDYYIPPSTRLKTLEDVQKWVYVEGKEFTGWRLVSLFPEFK
jgi:hypothetical protein